jgi:hypothetical protein
MHIGLVLPLDVLLIIIYYADQHVLYELGLTCRLILPHTLQQLWNMPFITHMKSLHHFAHIKYDKHPLFLKDLISGLANHTKRGKEKE